MLSDFIFFTIVSFFSVYGFVQVIIYILDFIYDTKMLKDKVIYTVVGVKNEEHKVESVAKALLLKALKNDSGVADNRVVIIDLGSTDNTVDILKLIEQDKKGILVMDKEMFSDELENNV